MGLSFKQGNYTDLTNSQTKTGDICFAYLDTDKKNMTICIKQNDGFSYLMPYPGDDTNTTGKALVSQGSSKSPTYATLGISGGGTGAVTLLENRLLCVNDSKVFSTTNHYIDSNQVQINQTVKFTKVKSNAYSDLNKLDNTNRNNVKFFVNGIFAMNGNIIPINTTTALSQYSLGTEKNKWKQLYCESIIGNNGASYRNGNETIEGEDKDHAYEIKTLADNKSQVKTDLINLIPSYGIRIDTRITNIKGETSKWVPPKSTSNANTVITINRFTGTSYLTQFGFNSTGIYYRNSHSTSIYGCSWRQILHNANPESGVGGNTQFTYVGSDGGIVATSATVGANEKFIYMNGGTMTASTATVGSSSQFIYMNSGTMTVSTANIGGWAYPVYLNNGVITRCRASGDKATFTHEDTTYTDKKYYWNIVPHIGNDGVMEIGKYIDFHETPHDNNSKYDDYSTRIVALATDTKNDVSLPLVTGQLIVRPSIGTAVGGYQQPVYINENGETVVCGHMITRPSAGIAVGGPLQPVYVNEAGQTVVCNYFNMNDSGNYWNIVPHISNDGVMEVGKYLDFHAYATQSAKSDQWDFGTRVQAQQVSEPNTVYLPSKGGLLIIAEANKVDGKEQWTTGVGSINKPVYINADGVVNVIDTIEGRLLAYCWPNNTAGSQPYLDDDTNYTSDCIEDGIIRFDSHIDKRNNKILSGSILAQGHKSFLTNNANALITINRHGGAGNYYTRLAFTNVGCHYQISENKWRSFAYVEASSVTRQETIDGISVEVTYPNDFNHVGSSAQPIYVDPTGKLTPCGTISAQYGGTGTSITGKNYDNRALFFSNNILQKSNVYLDEQWLFTTNNGGIGVAWEKSLNVTDGVKGYTQWLYLAGDPSSGSRSLHDTASGPIINFTDDDKAKIHGVPIITTNYGVEDPNSTPPDVVEEGALYFRIITE